jgi:hypothetical protein
MTTSVSPTRGFAVLDRLILEALGELRSARSTARRAGNRANVEAQTRAEEHLDALLDYRHVAQSR